MAGTGKRGPKRSAGGFFWKIAIYIRLSKEDGNDESLSVANQRKIILEFIESSFEGEYEIIDEYVDDGVTGTDYERPNFQRMRRDIETGAVNCVICKTLARAFRNYSDQGYFLENFFPRHATRFITLGEPKVDSFLNPEVVNGYEVPISGIMNDRYAGRTSMDVRRTFDMKRRKGEFIGSFAPYGYRKDPENKNHLLIDEEAAEVVREIFRLFLDGMSKRGIAVRLNELGILNPAAYKRSKGIRYNNPHSSQNDGMWNPSTIAYILKNPLYIGTMVQGKQRVVSYKVHNAISTPKEEWFVVEDTHEPIIDKATFQLVQDLCRKETKTAPGKRNVYLLSGFVFCADCGKAMARSESRGIRYYACRTYKDKLRTACSRHSIKIDQVEEVVLAAIQSQISLLESAEALIEEINQAPVIERESKRIRNLIQQRQEELKKTCKVSDELYMDWKSGDISREEYHRMKARIGEKLEHLQSNIDKLTQEYEEMEQGVQSDDPYLTQFLKYRTVTELERGMVVELVDKVLIHENKEVEIVFKYADQFKQIITSLHGGEKLLKHVNGPV